jgi:putative IMPACT (imprinted ancient) family translation regulator
VLAIVPRAEKVPTHTVMLALPYNLFERVKLLVGEWHGRMLDEEFAADITLTAQFTVERFPGFQAALRELSHGALTAEIIETNEATIMPLGAFADEQLPE